MGADIRFPHLGITLEHVGKAINIGGFSIAYYGMIIAFGMVMGYLMVAWQATRTWQNKEDYLDLALWDIVFAIVGARIYYVIFDWSTYQSNPMEVFNIRGGGLAIYGGVIGGVLTTFIFSKVRKISFGKLLDTACAGLLVGQIIGRWGNFFNREAFGGYTNNIFAMQIKKWDVSTGNLNDQLLAHSITRDGVSYIQVHPTFLYESIWNIGVLGIIIFFTKKKKYDGQIFLMYLAGYGLGRLWIEGLRTDQLLLFQTQIPVSQLLSGVLVVLCGGTLCYKEIKRIRGKKKSKGSSSKSK